MLELLQEYFIENGFDLEVEIKTLVKPKYGVDAEKRVKSRRNQILKARLAKLQRDKDDYSFFTGAYGSRLPDRLKYLETIKKSAQ